MTNIHSTIFEQMIDLEFMPANSANLSGGLMYVEHDAKQSIASFVRLHVWISVLFGGATSHEGLKSRT